MTLIVLYFHLVRKMRGYDDSMTSLGWAAQASVLCWNPGWRSQSGRRSTMDFFLRLIHDPLKIAFGRLIGLKVPPSPVHAPSSGNVRIYTHLVSMKLVLNR